MSLNVYNRKRNFNQTPEPKGKQKSSGKGNLRFVVQMHRATNLHFDFRLEFDGTFKSWAVPKGPSLNPLDQRLAIFVEDHPIEYGSFEGIIPKGNYGAGTVMIWDEGTYVDRSSENRKQSEAAMIKNFKKGHLTFVLSGKKLKGEFALIKLKKDTSEKAWLLVKKRDEYSTYKTHHIPNNLSAKTGRTIEQIAAQSEASGNIWLPRQKNPRKQKKTPSKNTTLKAASKDPMPRKIKPMIAVTSRSAIYINATDWVCEKKIGGLRALAEVEGKKISLYSKSGIGFEKKFPEIAEDLKNLNLHMVLDGEISKTRGKNIYYISDILYLDGKDLRKEKLKERKQILKNTILPQKHILPTETLFPEKLSGALIAKKADSIYRSGTSSDWLLLDNPSIFSTKVENGAIKSDEPRLTNLDKIYWPNEGITKGDLIDYYKSISDFLLPYLIDRPQSLNRQPNGIAAPGFYQKDMSGFIPKWLKTTRIFSESTNKSIDYVLCQDLRSLLYIVNLGCIEINPWFSRVGHLDHPDFMVIDLDPDENDFDHVIEIAQEFHLILENIGAENVCKTSGATGIHIGVPMAAQYNFDTVRNFAETLCRVVAKKYPATTSMDRNPNRRKRKIYLDYMQNRRGQTLAAPYCVRPKAGAPISMPLSWKDLLPGLKPEHFHMKNALRLVSKKKDPWMKVLGPAVPLEKCLQNLKKKYKV